ncbi:MAG: hypothetical protein CMF62_06435 [Magnetococcales bacterium]|nr:hypothetical protein [Magnetococcales bacterium]|tara:strand:- start:315212 stop:315778 length:567 start_codon:yes stop_codon:yes gene_type:complete
MAKKKWDLDDLPTNSAAKVSQSTSKVPAKGQSSPNLPALSAKDKNFAKLVFEGKSPQEAAKTVGHTAKAAEDLMVRKDVLDYIAGLNEKCANPSEITKDRMIMFYWRIMHDASATDANKISAARRVDELKGFTTADSGDRALVNIQMNMGGEVSSRQHGDEQMLKAAVEKLEADKAEDAKFLEAQKDD